MARDAGSAPTTRLRLWVGGAEQTVPAGGVRLVVRDGRLAVLRDGGGGGHGTGRRDRRRRPGGPRRGEPGPAGAAAARRGGPPGRHLPVGPAGRPRLAPRRRAAWSPCCTSRWPTTWTGWQRCRPRGSPRRWRRRPSPGAPTRRASWAWTRRRARPGRSCPPPRPTRTTPAGSGRRKSQRSGDRWRGAVAATRGQVLTYDGRLAATYYSSSHGGRSEASEDSWAYGTAVPYLRSVDDPWSLSAANGLRRWEAQIDGGDVARLVGLAGAGAPGGRRPHRGREPPHGARLGPGRRRAGRSPSCSPGAGARGRRCGPTSPPAPSCRPRPRG